VSSNDPAWDMPQINWQQQGSFASGQLPTLTDPDGGSPVCIGPFAREWLPFVLGAMDQLRNPSSWIVASDVVMEDTLARVDRLREIFGQAGDCVTCPLIRLQDCVLQSSCDGGATWTDVSGWSANFSGCVQSNLPPQVPPNPRGDTHNQHACNLAGYLATKVIQETMVQVHAVVAASGTELTFATDVMSLIGFAFPITYSAVLAFHDFWAAVSGQTLADINTAATDPTLWSDVTCAIYEAIVTVGYVDHTNFAAVATNLGLISYMFAWVAPSLHNYWNELGLANIQSQQAVGALDDVDCSGCTSSWCYWLGVGGDEAGFAAWTAFGACSATYIAGQGWQSCNGGGGVQLDAITINIPGGFQCVSAEVNYTTVHAAAGGTRRFSWSGGGSGSFALDTGAGTFTTLHAVGASPTDLVIGVETNTNNPTDFNYIHWVKIRGIGTPPAMWTPANCI